MKLNVTLNPTSAVSGFVIVVIFTFPDQKAVLALKPNDVTITATVIFSTAVAAPILSGTPVTTPVLRPINREICIGQNV